MKLYGCFNHYTGDSSYHSTRLKAEQHGYRQSKHHVKMGWQEETDVETYRIDEYDFKLTKKGILSLLNNRIG